jgi:hypothetical protein
MAPMVTERPGSREDGHAPSALEDLLESLDLVGARVVQASWANGMRDFWIDLEDGRSLLFEDSLQVTFHRSISLAEPFTIRGLSADEPSPVLLSLGPEVRFGYSHLVLEVGDGLLRVAFRQLRALPSTADSG